MQIAVQPLKPHTCHQYIPLLLCFNKSNQITRFLLKIPYFFLNYRFEFISNVWPTNFINNNIYFQFAINWTDNQKYAFLRKSWLFNWCAYACFQYHANFHQSRTKENKAPNEKVFKKKNKEKKHNCIKTEFHSETNLHILFCDLPF